MAADYDEVRSDVKESQDRSLEALQSANAPDARSVVRDLDESDALDDAMTPRRGVCRRGTDRSGDSPGRGRVHLLLLFPGPAPVPARARKERPLVLQRV